MEESKQLQKRPLETIENEINFYKQQTAIGIIETGKRLKEAKDQLNHGEWGIWLKEKVEFSQETARKFIKCADEYSNSNTYWNLGQSKIFALLDVPTDTREDFISQSHEINGQTKTVDEMTTRELQQAIKDKKEAELKLKKQEEENNKLIKELEQEKNKPKEKEYIETVVDKTDYELINKIKEEKRGLELKVVQLQDKISKGNITYKENPEILQELNILKEQIKQKNKEIEEKKHLEDELNEKKMLLSKYTSEDTNLDLVSTTSENRKKMMDFVQDMAKYSYIAETFNDIPNASRKEWVRAVYSVYKWSKGILDVVKHDDVIGVDSNIIDADFKIN